MFAVYAGNTLVVGLQEVKNNLTGVADSGATVTVTIEDAKGNNADGVTWPVTMVYGTDADGTAGYYGIVSETLSLTKHRTYTAVITATGSGAEVGVWRVPVQVEDRDE